MLHKFNQSGNALPCDTIPETNTAPQKWMDSGAAGPILKSSDPDIDNEVVEPVLVCVLFPPVAG